MSNYHQGIDYGRGMTNIDHKTRIRFGVIPAHAVEYFWEDAQPVYFYICPVCGKDWGEEQHDICPKCKEEIDESAFWAWEANHWEIKNKDYFIHTDSDGTDIWVEKSPYYTHCQFCSPCAPGAGYILNTVEDGPKAYCLGHDFFEDGAPYPVFDVLTGKEVFKE